MLQQYNYKVNIFIDLKLKKSINNLFKTILDSKLTSSIQHSLHNFTSTTTAITITSPTITAAEASAEIPSIASTTPSKKSPTSKTTTPTTSATGSATTSTTSKITEKTPGTTKIRSPTKLQAESPYKKSSSTLKVASQLQNGSAKKFFIAGNNGVSMYVF